MRFKDNTGRTLLERVFIGSRRRGILEAHNWYRNMLGGYAHPHAMDFLTRRQIILCPTPLLEYKCEHGSLAVPPGCRLEDDPVCRTVI